MAGLVLHIALRREYGEAQCFYLQWGWPWRQCLLWWRLPGNGSHVWTHPSCFCARLGMPWTNKHNRLVTKIWNGLLQYSHQSTWTQNRRVKSHRVCSQWGKGIKVIQRGLGSLDSLHTGVDGSSQGLLCWSLWTHKCTVTNMTHSVIV